MQTRAPKNIPEYAAICLQALIDNQLSHTITLGGAFGLMHYHEYRSTYDVDAWWDLASTTGEREQVVAVLEGALQPHGTVRTRSWGDVVSVELRTHTNKVFSFQIAGRTAQLEPAVASPWGGIRLDNFADLVASKMVALVERGAPRDFLDVYTVCQEGLVTPSRCWELWRRRQELTSGDADWTRARLAVQTHLARIEQHRPLEGISDPAARAAAEAVRSWFKAEFIDAPG